MALHYMIKHNEAWMRTQFIKDGIIILPGGYCILHATYLTELVHEGPVDSKSVYSPGPAECENATCHYVK